MATYYFSQAGDDLVGDGSYGNPWKTPQKALTSLAYGDVAIFSAGTYDTYASGTSISILISGNSANGPIELVADGAVTFDMPSDTLFRWMRVNQADTKVKFTNIQFTNSSTVNLSPFDIQAGCNLEFSGGSVDLDGIAKAFCSYNALSAGSVVKIKMSGGVEVRNSSTIPFILCNQAVASGSSIVVDGAAARDMASLLRVSAGTVDVSINDLVSGHMATTTIVLDVVPNSFSIVDCCLTCGGVGYGDYLFTMSDTVAEYYRDNPENFIATGNRFYSWDDRSDTWRLIWSNNVNWFAPWDSRNNWFAAPGFDEEEISTGAYKNAYQVGKPETPALSGAAFLGDSIMNGVGSSNPDVAGASAIFASLSGVSVASRDDVSLPGLNVDGMEVMVDDFVLTGAPKICFVAIGINNLNASEPTNFTNEELAERCQRVLKKLVLWGCLPIWLGIESLTGNPPDNSDVKAVNNLVQEWCLANGVLYRYILTEFEKNTNWKTDYYADITSNLHPNDAGHAIIARTALLEWLYTNPISAPVVSRPVELRPVRCMEADAR